MMLSFIKDFSPMGRDHVFVIYTSGISCIIEFVNISLALNASGNGFCFNKESYSRGDALTVSHEFYKIKSSTGITFRRC